MQSKTQNTCISKTEAEVATAVEYEWNYIVEKSYGANNILWIIKASLLMQYNILARKIITIAVVPIKLYSAPTILFAYNKSLITHATQYSGEQNRVKHYPLN